MPENPGRGVRCVVALLLALATAGAYAGALRADFIGLDDPVYVTLNDRVCAGLTLDGVLWAFRSGEAANWHPLTWISHMLDVELFGTRAWGHHATSVAIHVASSVLLLLALDRLTRAFWPSALVAALFALHPLHVESVAWISERKDVLSTLFFVLVLLAYARWVERPGLGRYLVLLLLYALGLMSKPMLVTLPFVLLLLDFWPLDRTTRGRTRMLAVEKLPLFVLAAAASLTTFLVQRTTGAVATSELLTLPVRASNALASYFRYLVKTFWPADLAAYYPHPKVVEPWPALAGLSLIVVVLAIAARARGRRPYLLVGWLWYLGMLVPVIGLVQVGAQAMADRYTYVPLVGVFVMLAFSLVDWPRFPAWSAVLVLLALAAATRHQVSHWKSSRTLFEHALAVTSENAIAEKCLGDALILDQDLDGAIRHLKEAVRIAPLLADANNNLGAALGEEGRFEESVEACRAELRERPRSAETRYNLGFALVSLGRVEEGIAEYEEALRLKPGIVDVHNRLGAVLGSQGRFEEAERHFRAELALRPRSAEVRCNVGFSLVKMGRLDQGILEYEEALRIDPGHFHANKKIGIALGSKGKLVEAVVHLQRALTVRPDDVETRRWLAVTLTLQGKVEEAIVEYRTVLAAHPEALEAMNGIAWIRATHPDPVHRDGVEALALAERACALSPQPNDVLHDTLAAALAEVGRFGEAIRACEQAIRLAEEAGESQNAERFRAQLDLYRAGKPFRLD